MKELPSLIFIREYSVVLKIIGETLTYFRLSKADKWEQAFTDGTSMYNIVLEDFVVALL